MEEYQNFVKYASEIYILTKNYKIELYIGNQLFYSTTHFHWSEVSNCWLIFHLEIEIFCVTTR